LNLYFLHLDEDRILTQFGLWVQLGDARRGGRLLVSHFYLAIELSGLSIYYLNHLPLSPI
jgi:hypothetical protein